MKYLLSSRVKHLNLLLLMVFLLISGACKKDGKITEAPVDAFAQVDNEVKYTEGTYNILFTLQKYPYKEVGVMMGTNKDLFHQHKDLTTHLASEVSLNRYGIFVNSLLANTTYYYQIYVKDSASDKQVYSDLYSFTTNP